MIKGAITENPWNNNNERNIRNTDKSQYNCGGYALGLFNWFIPWTEEHDKTIGWDFYHNETEKEEFIRICVNYMTENLPIRVISSISELKKREYAVAFRLSEDDFHFMKRGFNGVWYDKQGWLPFINTHKEKDVLNKKNWYDRYDSEIILLAVKKRG